MRAMKDSGIAWIGEIPGEWKLRKIKYIFRISSGTTPKSDNLEYWDGDIPWVTPADYKTENEYIYHGRKFLSKAGLEAANLQLLPVNSIVLSKRAPIGAVAITAAELTINQGCIAGIPIDDCSVRYYYFILSICTEQLNLLGSGTTFKELSAQDFGNFIVPTPDVAVQERIADYLDRKCSQIDAIIARQQEVVEKLKAYKLSVITEAVTKGLNPHAPMKDSGVEWIGEIPEHWKVPKIKYLATIASGGTPDRSHSEYWNGSINWAKTGELQNNELYETEEKVTELALENSSAKVFDVDTILVAMYGQGKTRGMTALLKVPSATNQACAGITVCSKDIIVSYLWLFLMGAYDALREKANGSGQPNLSSALIADFYVTLPPLQEQANICKTIAKRLPHIDEIIRQKEVIINKLIAYKKSLIYESATGKKEV